MERKYLASYPVARMRRSRRAQVDAAAAMLIHVQMFPQRLSSYACASTYAQILKL